jgi:hypothetical protein
MKVTHQVALPDDDMRINIQAVRSVLDVIEALLDGKITEAEAASQAHSVVDNAVDKVSEEHWEHVNSQLCAFLKSIQQYLIVREASRTTSDSKTRRSLGRCPS